MTEAQPAPSENVQVHVNQNKLSRDDELRLFALQTATKDRFHFDKEEAEPNRVRALADARAYYAFLSDTEGEPTA